MTELNQSYLTDRSDSNVTVQTTGTVIRPAVFIASAFADEARWVFEEDGLHVSAVDPANVAMFDIHIPAESFGRYDLDQSEVGIVHKDLRKSLNMARHGENSRDAVRMDVQDGHATVSVERGYEETDVDHRQTFLTVDPMSIRESPEMPDLNLPNNTMIDSQAFLEVLDSMDPHAAVKFTADEGLVLTDLIEQESTRTQYTEFGAVANIGSPEDESIVSNDYLTDAADAIYRAHVDRLTIRWGDGFPVNFQFGRQIDGETVLDGEVWIAPRIPSDD